MIRDSSMAFDLSVTLCHVCSRSISASGLGEKIGISVSAENDVLGLTLLLRRC